MPLTQMGVIYSSNKKHVRRHLYLEDPNEDPHPANVHYKRNPNPEAYNQRDNSELDDPKHIMDGESMVKIDLVHHHGGHDTFHKAINDAIVAKHGVNAVQHDDISGNCAVIDPDTNIVEQMIRADDEIDTFPDRILINSSVAVAGCMWHPPSNTFMFPYTKSPKSS